MVSGKVGIQINNNDILMQSGGRNAVNAAGGGHKPAAILRRYILCLEDGLNYIMRIKGVY